MKLRDLYETRIKTIDRNAYLRGDDLICDHRQITHLDGCPKHIFGSLYAQSNLLVSLHGGPTRVDGHVYLGYNSITSLDGAPEFIGKNFNASNNLLTSLEGIHSQIKHVGHTINFSYNPIKSHVLGLLLIDGLQSVYLENDDVQDIINKHLAGDKDVFECQQELMEAGFDDFAQL